MYCGQGVIAGEYLKTLGGVLTARPTGPMAPFDYEVVDGNGSLQLVIEVKERNLASDAFTSDTVDVIKLFKCAATERELNVPVRILYAFADGVVRVHRPASAAPFCPRLGGPRPNAASFDRGRRKPVVDVPVGRAESVFHHNVPRDVTSHPRKDPERKVTRSVHWTDTHQALALRLRHKDLTFSSFNADYPLDAWVYNSASRRFTWLVFAAPVEADGVVKFDSTAVSAAAAHLGMFSPTHIRGVAFCDGEVRRFSEETLIEGGGPFNAGEVI